MDFSKLYNYVKYDLLHMRPPLAEEAYELLVKLSMDDNYKIGDSAKSLGERAFKQMIDLNATIRLLEEEIKNNLPGYLRDNLILIETGTDVNHINLQFHFKNYNKMNKKLVSEIRSDFTECIQTDKLPKYKIKFKDTDFVLIFFLEDYI